MDFIVKFALQNISRRPGRSIAVLLFSVLFAAAIFGGTLLIGSMQQGLRVLNSRLGADIVVVPAAAKTKFNVNSVLLQGTPGYFYMERKVLDDVTGIEGVEKVSPQLFLASMTADCCSASLQIVGFDPRSDFAIQPWIRETYGGLLGDGDIVAGSNVRFTDTRMLKFYDVNCKVAAQLAKTGSALDNAIYANEDTVKRLIAASQKKGMNQYNSFDPADVTSAVLVKVKDGYDIEKVAGEINLHVRKVKAVAAKNLISDVASGLSGMSEMIGICIGINWILCVLIMMIVFTMLMNERKREFAVLRVLGTSRSMLSRMVISEAVLINLAGGAVGILLSFLFVMLFNTAIGNLLKVPFLMPSVSTILLLAGATLLISILAGGIISALSAKRISNMDTSLILLEGE